MGSTLNLGALLLRIAYTPDVLSDLSRGRGLPGDAIQPGKCRLFRPRPAPDLQLRL